MRIERRPFDDPDAAVLRDELEAYVIETYGFDNEPGVKPSVSDTAIFLVAVDEEPLGCAGLRLLDDGVAELKRMWVRPQARGRGVGRALIAAIEAEATARGVTTMRLETGFLQHEAVALYERVGYRPIACWGAYAGCEDSLCFERHL
ncbi:GNAT family N-acetyltransferase [Solirubrobacter soli]|uniref:GNAT family N-acetyltransferase n=1 Tax=Solirubrobacter soli TaxID=363832 RepID=UPI00040FAF27|nr:GNAT family N-acetyltransferase [Solirubrobacter soli]